MGQTDSKKSAKDIENDVRDIRRSIRQSKGKFDDDTRQEIQRVLINYSQELAGKTKKRKDTQNAQKLITEVTAELLSEDTMLDAGAVETNSFIHQSYTTKSKSTTSLESSGTTKSSKSSKQIRSEQPPKEVPTLATLDDIERKASSIKLEAKVAISNSDKSRLRFLKKSIENLAMNLELIPIEDYPILTERKENLEKSLKSLYRKVDSSRREMERNGNIQYLTQYHDREKHQQILEQLVQIEEALKTYTISFDKLKEQKEELEGYQLKIQSTDELTSEIQTKKTVISKTLQKYLGELQKNYEELREVIEYKLKQAEDGLDRFKLEISKFTRSSKSQEYDKYKSYLLQLKDYVTKLMDINQIVLQRKQNFMISISESLAALEQRAQANDLRLNPKTSHDIIDTASKSDEEVVIRPKTYVAVSNKTIDGFYSYWIELQEHILQQDHSVDELCSIYNLLKAVQNSIEDKTKQIQSHLQHQNSESPEIVTVKISDTAEINTVNNFTQIQEELSQLETKVNDATYREEDQEFLNIKSSLQSHRNSLLNLSGTDNIIETIDRILKKLEDKIWRPSSLQNRRSTSEAILQDVLEIGTRVNDLGQRVQSGAMTDTEIESTKGHLLKYQQYLKEMKLKTYSPNIKRAKDDVNQQIVYFLGLLLQSPQDNQEVKRLKHQIKGLKEKVSRFSGAYKNVLYKRLEDDLLLCMKRAEIIADPSEETRIKHEIEYGLKILQEKSMKDNEYNTNSLGRSVDRTIWEKLIKIREDINGVIDEINGDTKKTKEEFLALDGRLTLSILALDNLTIIKNQAEIEERQKLYDEIQRYLSYIQDQIAIAEQTLPPLDNQLEDEDQVVEVRSKTQAPDAAVEIARLENRFEILKTEIVDFVGDESSEKFVELDEILIETTLKLDTFKLEKGTELNNRKLKLLKEIQKYCELLDYKANQGEQLKQIENETREVTIRIDSFSGNYGDQEYNTLDEKLINLNVRARKLVVDEELKKRRETCIKNIEECYKKLNEAIKDKTGEGIGEGTLV